MIVKDGIIEVRYTDDFIMMMEEEYHWFFDTTDNLFKRFPDIRVFVRDNSLCFNDKTEIHYHYDDDRDMDFKGTVYFAKLRERSVVSLSKKEISFLMKNLKRREDNTFEISYDS